MLLEEFVKSGQIPVCKILIWSGCRRFFDNRNRGSKYPRKIFEACAFGPIICVRLRWGSFMKALIMPILRANFLVMVTCRVSLYRSVSYTLIARHASIEMNIEFLLLIKFVPLDCSQRGPDCSQFVSDRGQWAYRTPQDFLSWIFMSLGKETLFFLVPVSNCK